MKAWRDGNLYLTTQLLEMGANVVLALNMYDELKASQMDINVGRLSELLGVPVVPTVATRNQGTKELVERVLQAAEVGGQELFKINYGKEMEMSWLLWKNISGPTQNWRKSFLPVGWRSKY